MTSYDLNALKKISETVKKDPTKVEGTASPTTPYGGGGKTQPKFGLSSKDVPPPKEDATQKEKTGLLGGGMTYKKY